MLGDVHNRFACSKLKLDNLFLQWLAMPQSQQVVLTLLDEATNERTLQGPPPSTNGPSSPMSPSTAHLFFATAHPVSPQKVSSPRSPVSPRRSHSLSLIQKQASGKKEIPTFYFPQGQPISPSVRGQMEDKVEALLQRHDAGLTVPAIKELFTEVLELPKLLAYPLFFKLVEPSASAVTRKALQDWITDHNVLQTEPIVRMFDVLRKEGVEYVTQADLKQLLNGILLSHPGLEFLQETPEFQERYADTVIYRIMYQMDRLGVGRLSMRDLKRGDLLDALRQLDDEDDVNKALKYFSYEHFYVIYCKFWELDQDHDFLISKEDLIRYGNHSLTYRIIDRIFQMIKRSGSALEDGKMDYKEFVWFILSEEDKGNDVGLDYWFRCVDLDDDGCLQKNEMLYFYEEQLHRMECLAQEPVLFEDVICQMHDMIQPSREGVFTLADLRRSKPLSGILFNILFNLNKFVAFETRDPFLVRQEKEDPHLTEWDRFARTEYVRLAMEEEGEEIEAEGSGSADVWESEAPF